MKKGKKLMLPINLSYRNTAMLDSSPIERPVVLVYAEPLLATSMTFVRSQAEALNSFTSCYVSNNYLPSGLPLPLERVFVRSRRRNGLSRLMDFTFKALGRAPLFARRLRKLKPVLLHAHFGPMALRALPLARTLNIPLVATFHGYDATVDDEYARRSHHYSHRVYIRRRNDLELGASLFIAVSNFIRDELVRGQFPANKITVHYIGVDTEMFRSDPSVTREQIVLFTGRLAEKKGCEYLIRAMVDVESQLPRAELVIIGDGPLKPGLEQLAKRNLRRYRFLGYRTPEEVRRWMNRARVFSIPSVRARSGDAEGIPTVVVEAQAMGLPVAGFASAGIPEAVSHGESGLLGPERDSRKLAENITLMLKDDAMWAKFSRAGRTRVCAHFDLKAQATKLEDIYRTVLSQFAEGHCNPCVTGKRGRHTNVEA